MKNGRNLAREDGATVSHAVSGTVTDDRPTPQSAWNSALVVFVGNVVARGVGFLFPVVMARVTGRADFALVYFFVNTGFFVGELVLAGFPTALARFLAAPDDAPRGAWLLTSILAGIPLLVVSLAAGAVFAVQGQASPLLLGVVIGGLTIDAYYFGALRGLGRFGFLVTYRIAANVAQLGILLAAAALGSATVPLIVAAYSLSYLLPIVLIELTAAPVRSLIGLGSSRPTADLVRRLARLGIPALVSGLAYAAILGMDVFWVRILAPGQLADYGAARSLAMPMSLVPFAIGVVLMPRAAAASWREQERFLMQALGATTVAAVAAVIGYVVLSDQVVELVYPSTFRAAAGTLPLLAAGMGIIGVYSVLNQWWIGIGRAGLPAICLVMGAIAAGGSHLLLDVRLGGAGAAIAICVGASVAVVLLGAATAMRIRAS